MQLLCRQAASGIIVPGIADPFFTPIAQSIEESARNMGYTTLLHDTGRLADTALEGARILALFQVTGVIILGGSDSKDVEMAEWLDIVPTVVALRKSRDNLFPSVYVNHAVGAQALVKHLLSTGSSRIAFVGGDDDSIAATERMRGYQSALAEAGIAYRPEWITHGRFTIDGGTEAMERLLSLSTSKQPDAIMYASDAMAVGGLHRLPEAGVPIPDGIAVAGYGNIAFAAINRPPLNTVKVSKRELWWIAFEKPCQSMENGASEVENIEVPVELIVRQST